MARIFISHSSRDKKFVRLLSEDLSAIGHKPWLDEWAIKVGECIPTKVQEGISTCQYLIIVLSQHSVSSNWVEKEWTAKYWDEVESGRALVLPVLIEDCEIPAMLKSKKYADFRSSYGVGLVGLTSAISPTIHVEPKDAEEAKGLERLPDVTALIEAIHRGDAQLSEHIARALSIAQTRGNPSLFGFCKRQLSGYRGMKRDELEELEIQLRALEIFYSPFAELNLQYMGWSGNTGRLMSHLRSDEKFFPWKMMVFESVAELERKAADVSPGSVLTINMTLGDVRPDIEEHDHPVFGYGDPRSYVTILEGIKNELTRRLIDMLPGPSKAQQA